MAEAEKTARFLLSKGYDDPLILERLAVALIGQDKLDEAIRLLEQRLALEETGTAHFNMGLAMIRKDAAEQARQHMEKALKLEPLLAAAHKYLGLIARSHNAHKKAIAHFEEALAIQPNNPDFYQELLTEFKTLQQPQSYNRWLSRAKRLSTEPEPFASLEPLDGSEHD